MKKALQSILPGAKDSAAAKLRRNNPPGAVPAGDGLRPITADITDSEDDGGGSSGGETPPPPRIPAKRTGGGGGGGSAQDAVRAESFESLMEEYRRFERKATAGGGPDTLPSPHLFFLYESCLSFCVFFFFFFIFFYFYFFFFFFFFFY